MVMHLFRFFYSTFVNYKICVKIQNKAFFYFIGPIGHLKKCLKILGYGIIGLFTIYIAIFNT